MAQGNGGGKPPPPPPPPPPIHYRLTWVNNIWGADADFAVRARDMNEAGVVVGKTMEIGGPETAFRFFYDQQLGWVTQDLNDLGGDWTDLGGAPLQGWYAATAEGINASGQIVGAAVHPNYLGQAYVLSFPAGSPPEFLLLPRSGNGAIKGGSINDAGVVVADALGGTLGGTVYTPWSLPPYTPVDLSIQYATVSDINDSGVIVTRGPSNTANVAKPWRINPDLTYDYDNVLNPPLSIVNRNFYGVNASGMICGRRVPVGSGKNKISGGPIRIDASGVEKLLAASDNVWAGGINDAGHVVYSSGFLYTDRYGSLGLNQLVVNPDTYWTSSGEYPVGITNIDGTGFGKICGVSGNRSYILTPEPVAGN